VPSELAKITRLSSAVIARVSALPPGSVVVPIVMRFFPFLPGLSADRRRRARRAATQPLPLSPMRLDGAPFAFPPRRRGAFLFSP
jgi:hypothetical protein